MNTQGKTFTKEDINEIELKFAKFILDGLNSKAITEEDSQKMAQQVLSRVALVTTQTEYVRLLQDLSNKWPVFDTFLKEELIKEADKASTDQFGQKGI